MSDATKAISNSGLSRRGLLSLAGVSLLPLAATACGKKAGDKYPTKGLHIMAPAAAGGGWDITANAVSDALTKSGLADEAKVYDVEGAAGTVGLAQFVAQNHGDPYQLMITGLVMIGGIVNGASSVGLSQVNKIATLTAEQELVVVPKDSPYESLKDVMDAAKSDPTSITWGGGSAGGTDEILVLLMAKAYGADPKKMKYQAASGGGESKDGLLNGSLDVGVSGPSEYVDLVKKGDLRPLAVSGKKSTKVAGTAVPTCKDQGVDVELMNWRGIVAPAGISDADKKSITALMTKMVETKEWKDKLAKEGWENFFKTGDDAKKFYDSENARVTKIFHEVGKA
ncbi:MAG TPA: tripartite tricarboxylate transporter substrate-binding protein [Stackebrandtia sp.]|jgi:putative tricarboxylic transport membrane protein|uniref:Bug family tripartite tricarboxylate transporter substrate binding protein n=1 Tax=Stackebrandtia sp. TaxID=2023065 RepID=UPI002D56BD31|nr:tripartite tricarboxylate transporter substrate-binding protein [Stackebrandtia sp.]HZE41444.1 tripartite tricarboxylate transporter substrate-binding protein [Stackebrandtia sp.]